MTNDVTRDAFRRGYVEAMLWANATGLDGKPLAFPPGEVSGSQRMAFYVSLVTPEALATMHADADAFLEANYATLRRLLWEGCLPTWSEAGGDFALTRNGHGAGFWDRYCGTDSQARNALREMAEAAKVYGDATLYVGDDGMIHHA